MKHDFKTFRGPTRPTPPAGGAHSTPSPLPTEDRIREIIKEELSKKGFWAKMQKLIQGDQK